MRVTAALHGIVLTKNTRGSLTGLIQVKLGDNPQPVTVFEDDYFDPITGMQDLIKQYVELTNE